MSLIVCPLSAVEAVCAETPPSHILSLLGPTLDPPALPHLTDTRRLRLLFNDIVEPAEGMIAPSEAHVRALVEFGGGWDRRAPMLIHCWAGISRSTAAAYILACEAAGPGSEGLYARRLREASPTAHPNRLMIEIADAMLGRDGAMRRAIAHIGPGRPAEEGERFELPL